MSNMWRQVNETYIVIPSELKEINRAVRRMMLHDNYIPFGYCRFVNCVLINCINCVLVCRVFLEVFESTSLKIQLLLTFFSWVGEHCFFLQHE